MKKSILITTIIILSIVSYSQTQQNKNQLITNFGYVYMHSNYDKVDFPFHNSLFALSIQYKYNFYKKIFITPEIYFGRKEKYHQFLEKPIFIDIKETIFNFTYGLNFGYDIIKRKRIELSTSIGGGRHIHNWTYIYLSTENLPDTYQNKIMGFYNWGWNANIDTRYIFKNNSFLGVGYNYKSYGGFYFHTFQMSFGVKF